MVFDTTINYIIELEETQTNLKKALNKIQTLEVKDEKEKKELIELRELFFNLNDKINFNEITKVIDLNKLKDIKDIVIVGGISPAQQKIKSIIPNAIIINSENFDIKLLKDKNMFLFFNKMSHAIYYKLISSEYKSINYFKNFNMDLCTQQIHDVYFKE